jgi:hypothetical protein
VLKERRNKQRNMPHDDDKDNNDLTDRTKIEDNLEDGCTTSMQMIPIDSADFGASLPTSEELRASAAMSGNFSKNTGSGSGNRSKRRRFFCYALGFAALLVTVIGITVAVNKKNNESQDVKGSSVPEPRKVDMATITEFLRARYNILLTSVDTPQYKAAKWFAEDDGANLPLPGSSKGQHEGDIDAYTYRYLARYIMALNYYAMGGENWNSQLNFLTETDICNWNQLIAVPGRWLIAGVICSSATGTGFRDEARLCK